MESLKNTFFLILGIAIIGWSFYTVLQQPAPARYQARQERKFPISNENSMKIENSKLKIGDKTISVEIADTDEERIRGLSGRDSLSPDSGMLFIFPEEGRHGFWMRDMNFPIDIVWINSEWKVIGVEREVSPDTYPQTFYPPSPVKYALEINSGEASRLGIDMGLRLYLGTEF